MEIIGLVLTIIVILTLLVDRPSKEKEKKTSNGIISKVFKYGGYTVVLFLFWPIIVPLLPLIGIFYGGIFLYIVITVIKENFFE